MKQNTLKKSLTTLLLSLLCLQVLAGGGKEKYIQAMKASITLLDSAKTMDDFRNVANRFERIGNAEKKEWLPHYYAAFSYVMMSYMQAGEDMEGVDPILDKAQAFIDVASDMKKPEADQAEVVLLKGMILGSRIMVDPQVRGMQYGMQSGQLYAKAVRLSPENPRCLSMAAQNKMFTPKQFGGGREVAIPMMEQAAESFKTWKVPSEIHPDWGEERNAEVLEFAKSGKKMEWEEGAPEEEAPDATEKEAPDNGGKKDATEEGAEGGNAAEEGADGGN